jgi:hypothetical protein
MPDMQIDAALPVAITWPARQWLVLRAVLTKVPYDIAEPLISDIDQHLQAAAAKSGNGDDRPLLGDQR